MRALILAAGLGTRLAASVPDRPKILAPLAGASLLDWQLAYLASSGVTQVAINLHHMADQVIDALEHQTAFAEVLALHESQLRGTAGALLGLGGFASEPLIVLYGDVLTDASLPALLERHRRSGALATLVCCDSPEREGKGLVQLDRHGRVVAFAEKPAQAATGALDYVNAGVCCVDPALLQLIEDGDDLGRDVWPRALRAGRPLAGQVTAAYVRDVGTPDALRAADDDIRGGALRW